MKHTLKAPGSKRLILTCDKLLLSFAFDFNLRHYNPESTIYYIHVLRTPAGV